MKKGILSFIILILFVSSTIGQIRRNRVQTPKTNNTLGLDYSRPQEYEIANIKVTGTNYLDGNTLVSLTNLKVGDRIKIPGDDISNAIKKLWKHGLVGDVKILIEKIETGKIYLIVELTERPRLSKFSFQGVSKSQKGDLKELIAPYRGKVLTDAMVNITKNNVRKHYVDKGFLNCEVDIIKEKDTLLSNHVRLNIKIQKNPKVKIDRVYIDGAEEVSLGKIKGKMKNTKERVRLSLFKDIANRVTHLNVKSFILDSKEMDSKAISDYLSRHVNINIFKSSKYIKSDFEEDKKSIINYLNSKGFRDAVVAKDSIFKTDTSSIAIYLKVEEGNKYFYRNITWSGNYVYNDARLQRVLGIKSGDVYNKEEMDKRLQMNPQGIDISGLYMDNGYLFFNIQPVEIAVMGDSIDIEMRIYEGAQATVSKVIITGNDRTNDHVIRRELRTMPGDLFSRTNIIRDQQQLGTLGYFDPEQIQINPVPNPVDNTVDIEYKLVERPNDQIELSGGWGGMFGFVGTLGLTFNNFSLRNVPHFEKWHPLPVGDGQKLSIRMQANGKQFQSYTASFTEPWLGGKKPNSFTVSLNTSIQNIDERFSPLGAGSFKVNSVTVGLGRRLTWPDNYFTLSNSLSYKIYKLDNYFQQVGALPFNTGVSNTFLLTSTLARSSIDNPMYPKSGSTVSLSASFTPPFSKMNSLDYSTATPEEVNKWVEYMKFMFDAKYYLNLVGKLVLESRIHFGFMNTYSPGTVPVGPFERFRVGGDGLAGQNFVLGTDIIGLRGYDNNTIRPIDQYDATYTGTSGGTIYAKYAMELRYPITTGAAATIYVLAFGEAGNNWDNYQTFSPFDTYKAAGFGARLFMPAFGLIGLNWGYGFDTLPGSTEPSGMQFQFTIGQQLR
ncbi:Outer membrane protein assembly factor YaeT [hydrothermal vent metagenome]|uniref:Outer membrane protein assembly factor YaeT n=1 Tax=hydrothermal vent metagenome TaxID=652676 RepID=A0A3B0U662_9ZZZZ